MIQILVRYLIYSIFFLFIITINSLAFHKEGNSEIDIDHAENIKKKDIQSQYCTIQVDKVVKLKEKSEEKSTDTKDQEKEKKSSKDENTEEVEKEFFYKVISYHGEPKEAPKELDFSILKNKINKNTYIGHVSTIETLLNYYCVQEIPEGDKSYIYKKGNSALFDEIAQINGYSSRESKIEGEIFDSGKINLSVEGKTLIYAKAQFIIDEENRLAAKAAEEAEKKRIAAEKEKKRKEEEAKKIAKEKAKKKGNQQWISENKQKFKIQLKFIT